MTHAFAVDLRGLIDLLSEHLYAGPEVYVRELLQNGVDALRARADVQPEGAPSGPMLEFAVHDDTLTFTDNGVGLTQTDIHTFLATIGRSSKRGSVEFIGQFGIGLLACFLVSERIEVVSRSVHGTPPLRWVGLADGTYTLEDGPDDTPVGTRVVLRARPDRAQYLLADRVAAWAADYGALLPVPVVVEGPGQRTVVNAGGAPWLDHARGEDARRAAVLAYGTALLGTPPLDFVDIDTEAGAVRGVAFVLPWTPTLEARGQHRVFVRHMRLSEEETLLVPRWAFFVKAVLDAGDLRPNAARDALRDDATLHAARREIARTLRRWLVTLAERRPDTLRQLIALHYLSIKALAAEDDAFLDLFVPWLPFESSAGRLTLPEVIAHAGTPDVRYVADLNVYRQASQLAAPGGPPVIHAVYTYDATLLERYGALHPEVRVTRLDAGDLVQDLTPLTPAERTQTAALLAAARDTLAALDADARLSRFEPAALCALAFPRAAREARRTRDAVGGAGGGLWADLVGDLHATPEYATEVHFNLNHPLLARAAQLPDGPLLRRVLGMLYVQALLLGHHPLTARELGLLNGGLLDLIGAALDGPDAAAPGTHLN